MTTKLWAWLPLSRASVVGSTSRWCCTHIPIQCSPSMPPTHPNMRWASWLFQIFNASCIYIHVTCPFFSTTSLTCPLKQTSCLTYWLTDVPFSATLSMHMQINHSRCSATWISARVKKLPISIDFGDGLNDSKDLILFDDPLSDSNYLKT